MAARVRLRAVTLLVLACALLAALPGTAAADREYTEVFSQNRQGDITGTGNTLLSCFDTDTRCAAARNGTATGANLNNNNLPMDWVDVDDDPATFNSSSATLNLPEGARVLEARLYFTGRLEQGADSGDFKSRPAPDPGARDQVLFKPPGAGAYLHLTAHTVDGAIDDMTGLPREYQGIVDVTDEVRAAGSGQYTVANLQLGTGLDPDQAGGWALAVAYEDPDQPPRNLTIFDGFRWVRADGPDVEIPLNGFRTPPTGPVVTNLGLVAIEGDRGTYEDSATINAGTGNAFDLTNAGNPADNFFNSSITDRTGANFTQRHPAYVNQMGFDADIVNATDRLQNNQTSTRVRLHTNGDGYAPNAVSFATDLYSPSLHIVKTVTPGGDAHLGEELTYRVSVANTGLDAATNVILTDAIPAGTSYVRDSLSVVGGANEGTKSDAPDDDQAEFDSSADAVRFRLGTGANATSGGRLEVPESAPLNATEIQFSVRVHDSGLPSGFRVVNDATVGFVAQTLDTPLEVTSPDVVTPVRIPDLAMTKSHDGELRPGRHVPFTLHVSNVGDAPTIGPTTVTDTLPDELTFAVPPSGDGWDCSATSGRTLHCTRNDTLDAGEAFPDITFVARVAGNAPPGQITNTATVETPGDGDPSNDSDTNTARIRRLVDLALAKFSLTPRTFPGREVRFVILVHNHGPHTATHVTVHDFLPRGLTLFALNSSRGRCAGATCHLGRLRPGRGARIIVRAIAGDNTGGRRLRDVAVVRARQREVTLRNNRDSAFVRVVPLVDLQVTKTAPRPTVAAGSNVSFVVVVENHGPSTATHVSLTDVLPPGLQLISATPLQGSCTGLTCALGTLRAGAATQIAIEARSDPALAGETVTNMATATARQPELNLSNNTGAANVTFSPAPPPRAPDVRVTKTTGTNRVNVGGQLTYRLVATNRGDGTARSVLVTDTPDPNLQPISVRPSQGRCTVALTISCDLGSLAPRARAHVAIVARATAPGRLRNGVTVASVPGSDDGAVKGITARRGPRLGLRKQAHPRWVRPGGESAYALTVRARGKGTARRIRVCDSLPRALRVESFGGGRLHAGRRVCWTIARLRGGHSRTLHLRVTVASKTRPGWITNRATLTFADRAPLIARARIRVLHHLECPPHTARVGPVARIAC